MKHVLVSGGAGFIGANLCGSLLKKGYYVTVIDNFITSSPQNIKELMPHNNFKCIQYDIVKKLPRNVLLNLSHIDEIYHLACPTGVPNIDRLGEEMALTCSVGTKNMLDMAQQSKAAFLFTSSSEVYGDPLVRPQSEQYTGNVDIIGERSPYEEGKRYAEMLVKLYVKKYGIHGKIVRIFNTYGPHMSNEDSRVIPSFIRSVRDNKVLRIQGEGQQKRTFCYVDDLIKGLRIVMEKGADGEVYNLGSDSEITINDLAKLILLLCRKQLQMRYVTRPTHDHQQRLPSLEKIAALGWKQSVGLEEGLRRTLQWYGL